MKRVGFHEKRGDAQDFSISFQESKLINEFPQVNIKSAMFNM